jgi:hypothetical protein
MAIFRIDSNSFLHISLSNAMVSNRNQMEVPMRGFLFAACLASVTAAAAADLRVAFPEGYRAWTHVKSMVIGKDHPLANPFAGIHHIYANAEALQGLESGRYGDGAVLVFDLIEAQTQDGATIEGARKFIGVMRRDAGKYAATGGWGYEVFAGGDATKPLVSDGGAGCQACHTQAAATGFVFSKYRP